MAEKNNNQIKITIYGYNVAATDEATRMIMEKILQLKLTFSGPTPRPTKIKTATTLISPHKHKSAQEQFEQRTHRKVIYVTNISPTDLEVLEKLRTPDTAHLEVKAIL